MRWRHHKGKGTFTQTAYCPTCRKPRVVSDNDRIDKALFDVGPPLGPVGGCVPPDILCCSRECKNKYLAKLLTETLKDYNPDDPQVEHLLLLGVLGHKTYTRHEAGSWQKSLSNKALAVGSSRHVRVRITYP